MNQNFDKNRHLSTHRLELFNTASQKEQLCYENTSNGEACLYFALELSVERLGLFIEMGCRSSKDSGLQAGEEATQLFARWCINIYTVHPPIIGLMTILEIPNGKLVPAVAQDWRTGEVLMLAYMNNTALERTIETGVAHYWSRSRGKLWRKGESSGNEQLVKEILVDCDADAILLKVEQKGGACHTGYRSCFYRTLDGRIVGEKVFEPAEVYKR